jgi:hypothetical protein
MKILIIAFVAFATIGCSYDPIKAAARSRDCSTITYSKYNGRLGMSTVCRSGRDISIIRNM